MSVEPTPLRELRKSESYFVPRIRLYLDDIEKIYSIFQEIADQVIIHSEGYALDTLSQLPQLHRDEIKSFSLDTWSQDIRKLGGASLSLELNSSGAHLYGLRLDMPTRGAYEEVRRILLAKDNRFLKAVRDLKDFSFLLIALAVFAFLIGFLRVLPTLYTTVLGLALLLWAAVTWYASLTSYAAVVPRHKAEAPSFIQRNRDAVILVIISSVISLATGYLLAIFTRP